MEILLYFVGFMGFVIWIALKMDVNKRLDNYDFSNVDQTKLGRDIADGVSVAERRRRMVSGYYNKY